MLYSCAAQDQKKVSLKAKPIPINVPSRTVDLNLGMFKTAAYAISVEKPIVLRLRVGGEVIKASGGFHQWPDIELQWPDIEVVNNVTKRTIPSWDYDINFDENEFTADNLNASYLLPKGAYTITLRGGSSTEASETDELALNLTAEAEQLTIPDWLPRVNDWLTKIGLGDKIRLVASFRGPSFRHSSKGPENTKAKSLIASMSQLQSEAQGEAPSPYVYIAYLKPDQILADQILRNKVFALVEYMAHLESNIKYMALQRESYMANLEYMAHLEREKYFDDKLFIVLAIELGGDTPLDAFGSEFYTLLDALESEFYKTHHMSLWSRLFRKITLYTGVPSKNIFGLVPVWCNGPLLYEARPGNVIRDGFGCASTSVARDVPAGLATQLGSAVSGTAEGIRETFSTIVGRYLDEKMEAIGGTLQYLYRDDFYVEAIVRGVRGWVIKGSNQWEKVHVSFALLGTGDAAEVRIFLDGMLASGFGNMIPPDSKFTYSMEPKYASDITALAQGTLDDFMHYLRQD